MKKWIGKMADLCLTAVRSPVMWILVVLYCFALFSTMTDAAKNLVLWKRMVTAPEPEVCALCAEHDSVWNCPYLVKLETGDVGRLAMHDLVPVEIESAVSDSYLFFVTDLLAENTTDAQGSTTSVTLPENTAHINPKLFCHDCRAKIASVIEEHRIDTVGYVLADLSDPENIQIYSITDGAEYEICGYTVTITQEKRNAGPTITVAASDAQESRF